MHFQLVWPKIRKIFDFINGYKLKNKKLREFVYMEFLNFGLRTQCGEARYDPIWKRINLEKRLYRRV